MGTSSEAVRAPADCVPFHSSGTANFVISVLLLLGTVGSYVPQWHRIIQRRSSEGLSAYFILLGSTSTTCGLLNIIILSQDVYDCWSDLSRYEELSASLGIWQVGAQWAAFLLLMLLFIRFFPRGSLLKAKSGDLSEQSDYRQALTVVALCVIHAVLSILISVFIYYLQPQLILWWAGFLGLQATILTSVQYFPQIWMTYRLKHIGSLSIPMMCIQTPGGFVLAASMYARLGPSGWSQWCIYLAVASCQGVLLVMAIYYEYFTAKKPPLEDVPYAPLGHSGAAAESSPDSLSQRSERAALMDHVDPELSP